jgi:uncharacterized protein YgiB involved in biofilm formation
MRKSRYVSVLLAGAAALGLSSCDGNAGENATVYGDANTCGQDWDSQSCTNAYSAAREEHVKTAPKFATREECEAAGYTACEIAPQTQATTQTGGGGMFMPMMMGYMMGRSFGGGGMMAQPVYGNRSGHMFTTGGRNIGQLTPGTTSLAGQKVAMRTPTRGGFAGRMGAGS